MTTQTPTAEIE